MRSEQAVVRAEREIFDRVVLQASGVDIEHEVQLRGHQAVGCWQGTCEAAQKEMRSGHRQV